MLDSVLSISHVLTHFLKDFIYLFLKRGEGREKGKETSISCFLIYENETLKNKCHQEGERLVCQTPRWEGSKVSGEIPRSQMGKLNIATVSRCNAASSKPSAAFAREVDRPSTSCGIGLGPKQPKQAWERTKWEIHASWL